jgi:hypothetical protein
MRARAGGRGAAAAVRGVVQSQAQSFSLRMAPAAMRSWAPLGPRLPVWTHVRREPPGCQCWYGESADGARGITQQHRGGPALHTVMDCSGEKSLRSAVAIAAGTEVLAEAGKVVDAPSMHTIQVSDVSVSFEASFEASLRGRCLYPATVRGPGGLAGDKNVSRVLLADGAPGLQ